MRVGEQTIAAETVILATGSVPRAIPGVEFGGRVIGTEQAWALAELPARLAVVGAGASGAEIAGLPAIVISPLSWPPPGVAISSARHDTGTWPSTSGAPRTRLRQRPNW